MGLRGPYPEIPRHGGAGKRTRGPSLTVTTLRRRQHGKSDHSNPYHLLDVTVITYKAPELFAFPAFASSLSRIVLSPAMGRRAAE